MGHFLPDCCDQGKEPYSSKDDGIDESFIQIRSLNNDEYSKNFLRPSACQYGEKFRFVDHLCFQNKKHLLYTNMVHSKRTLQRILILVQT